MTGWTGSNMYGQQQQQQRQVQAGRGRERQSPQHSAVTGKRTLASVVPGTPQAARATSHHGQTSKRLLSQLFFAGQPDLGMGRRDREAGQCCCWV